MFFQFRDGDTGTNMAFTLLPIVEECSEQVTDIASETYSLMANTALDSARGNSGTIIAQYFYGMSEVNKNIDKIDVFNFAKGLINVIKVQEIIITNPEEGTIITVMNDVAEESQRLIDNGCDEFYSFIKNIYKKAEISLKETKIY